MPTTTITIPSNRIYLDELPADEVSAVLLTRNVYSRAKEELYNVKYENEFLSGSVQNDTSYIKNWIHNKFNLSSQDYYITSLQSHTRGMIL